MRLSNSGSGSRWTGLCPREPSSLRISVVTEIQTRNLAVLFPIGETHASE